MGSLTMESRELRQAFDPIDVDRDGTITAEELINVIEKLGGSMSEDEARGLIRKADFDKNGSIDFTEFSSLWSSLAGEGEDKNRVITRDEMMKAVSLLSKDKKSDAEHFISQLDIDQDGKVSYPEFLLVWRYRALGSLKLPL